MPDLKNGLNITRKSGLPPLGSRPPPKKTIFDDDDSPDEDASKSTSAHDGPQSISTLGGFDVPPSEPSQSPRTASSKPRPSAPSLPSGPPKRKAPHVPQYGDLSARQTSLKHAEVAQELDPTVYDYDAIYDTLHAKPDKSKSDDRNGAPKYMTSLLAAAEVRKRDQLRAKEKALQREREEEGEEFADKEKFVTGAYKVQQEEMRRVEEEEREREAAEMEKRKKMGGGMTGLYKDLLSREDERHEKAMKAAEDLSKNGISARKEAEGEDEDKGQAEIKLAKAKGAVVNEDGQIVDKRQLLSAGLNVAKKNKAPGQSGQPREDTERIVHRPVGLKSDARQGQRERQTRMLEQQLEEASKRAAEDKQTEQEVLERNTKRRATEKDVSSAKIRYLARKAAAAEAAKKEGG